MWFKLLLLRSNFFRIKLFLLGSRRFSTQLFFHRSDWFSKKLFFLRFDWFSIKLFLLRSDWRCEVGGQKFGLNFFVRFHWGTDFRIQQHLFGQARLYCGFKKISQCILNLKSTYYWSEYRSTKSEHSRLFFSQHLF